tara:strand:- start:197 stop:937 length:741 start_codon:yes stop_codon:yes gene_type:complete
MNATKNQFCVFSEATAATIGPEQPEQGVMTLQFPSYPGVVGNIVGPKWARVCSLRSDFQDAFPGFDLTVEYDGNSFLVLLPAISSAIEFVNTSLGVEIALANEPIQTNNNCIGAVIGKKGCGLRTIESAAPCDCVVYYDDGAFFVKFPYDTPTSSRVHCMAVVKQNIYGRSKWLEDRLGLSDTASTVTASSTADSVESVMTDLFSEMSPTPSEAFGSTTSSEISEEEVRETTMAMPMVRLKRSKSI